MIDKTIFGSGMGVLAGNFSRTLDEPLMAIYYRALSAVLSTEQFEHAIQRCLAEETFWPPVAVILSKAEADDNTRAALAFEHVNRVTSNAGGFRYLSHATFHAEFDAPTRAAISAVGGLAEIADTTTERWAALQRKFMAAYQSALQPRLAAAPIDPAVRQLVSSTAKKLSGRDRAAGNDR